jgi:hypothetical protein
LLRLIFEGNLVNGKHRPFLEKQMTHSALSTEGKLKMTLEAYSCSLRAFAEISTISVATLSNTLNVQSTRSFTPDEVEKIESSLDAMKDYQARMNLEYGKPVMIDWTRKDVAEIIQIRKISKLIWQDSGDPAHKQRASEYGIPRIRI